MTMNNVSKYQLKSEFIKWRDSLNVNKFVYDDCGRAEHYDGFLMDIEIAGIKFNYITDFRTVDEKGDTIIMLYFQSDSKIYINEFGEDSFVYPLLDIGIKVHYTKAGKFKPSIIKNGVTNATKLV